MTIESIEEVRQAVERAKREIYRADQLVSAMADLCAGKLQSAGVAHGVLAQLKKELANYNIHTGKWSQK